MANNRSFVSLLSTVFETVESYGKEISPASRLGRMKRALLDANGIPEQVPPDSPDFQVALEGVRDIQLLAFICEQLKGSNVPQDIRLRMKRMMRDSALPQDSSQNTDGRDEQCEMYVAAVCAKAGLKPLFKEPDLQCSLEATPLGVAVKRIKSYTSFGDRVKDAAHQIYDSGVPGVIIADVSVMLNTTNERIAAGDDAFTKAAWTTMNVFVHDHMDRLLNWTKGKWVHGIILIDHHVRFHPQIEWGLDTITLSVPLVPHNKRRQAEFAAFTKAYERGIAEHVSSLR